MILINYQCNDCGCKKGHFEIVCDEPMIECDNPDCGETEVVKDYDIIGND